jgi:hypothetical protein
VVRVLLGRFRVKAVGLSVRRFPGFSQHELAGIKVCGTTLAHTRLV